MAYDDKEQRREFRHTVRFKKADDQLITVLAARLGVQKATLIQNMALLAAEKELQKIGLGGQQQAAAGGPALHC
ncbi:hypothetical protein [Alicycliphilus denitrificans]|uniref:hypothetical protein n=1 Tax=Alicycliphilus denitrificans TaxID=179636 RepID=UPI0001DA021F|nr:hypothetical protein [Alicycliphilus denitrificans]ADU99010.1 hypothetical protein Alide_1249 [Alicycliphilus denitrificans BC]